MITVKIKLDEGAVKPVKAHRQDAGFDLFAMHTGFIPPHSSKVFDTGVHIAIPDGACGVLMSKSGLNIKHDITSEGLIDAGYTGSIRVKLYNNGDREYTVKPGDKISQIVFIKTENFALAEVAELDETERGSNGFGSSGR